MSLSLPPALAPWAPELDLFPRELAVPLGALARPVDALVGPLRDRRRGSDGEPDGYSDIARRGPYERLLLSEWLLASEEPDEWTRRAAAGEHSFLEISRREPAADRLAAVLFDAGPSQWGAARIAHLAALLVLLRRARAGGARFAWGVLQQPPPAPDAPLPGEVSEAGVLRLTRAAAPREATEADVSAWRERLVGESAGQGAANAPELWLVGGGRLAPLADRARASLLTIREPDEDVGEGSPAFLVANASFGPHVAPRAAATDVRLPLPEADVCVRLLRDPFGARSHDAGGAAGAAAGHRAGPRRDDPASELVFSLHGSKLFARGAARGGTTLLVFPVGNSPAANVSAPPKQYRSQYGTPFFAAGRVGRVTVLASLASDGTAVRIETFGKGGGVTPGAYRLSARLTPAELDGAGAGERLWPVLPLYAADGSVQELVTVLPDGQVVRLRPEGSVGGNARVMAPRAFDLCRTGSGILVAGLIGKTVALLLLRDSRDPPTSNDGRFLEHLHDVLEPGSDAARVAAMGPTPPPRVFLDESEQGGPVLLHPSPDHPTAALLVNGLRSEITLPVGRRLVGVGRDTTGPHGALLFLLSEDGKTLDVAPSARPDAAAVLFSCASPITRAVKSPYGRLIAYATEAGEVGVWSLEQRGHVYRRLAPARKEAAA